MYNLEYLPSARQDMIDIVQYISGKLCNPEAAGRLAAELIEAGERLTEYPYAYPVYTPIRSLKHEYRKLSVRNYLMFYWVDAKEKLVTVARVIYGKRDYKEILK